MRRSLLLICVSLIIGYVVGSSRNDNFKLSNNSPMNIDPLIVQFFNEPVLGTLNIKLDPSYDSTLIDAEPIWSLPEKPKDTLPKGNLVGIKIFDENEGADDLTLMRDWKIKTIDINNDGVNEKVMTNSIGFSNAPQLVRIVKDDMVIFEYVGSVVGVEEAYDKEGFILTTQIWQDKNGLRVRYVIDGDGTIRPLWQQRHAGIEWLVN